MRAAQERVQTGQVSRARQEFVGSPLAPKKAEMLKEFRSVERDPGRSDATRISIPQCTIGFSACAWWSGCTNEMLKVCRDDQETFQLLGPLQPILPVPHSPRSVTHCLTLANVDSTPKERWRSQGESPWGKPREAIWQDGRSSVPHSSSHCPRGQEWIAWVTLCERSRHGPNIDGVGAYDHVLRSSLLAKLLEVPALRPLLPFVRSIHSQACRYVWRYEVGRRHEVQQHEGGEQGDPLMPFLFSAIHNALRSGRCWMARNCSPFWTMCTSCHRQQGLDFCTIWLGEVEQHGGGPNCTMAKPDAGTGRDCAPRTWKSWVQRCGVQEERLVCQRSERCEVGGRTQIVECKPMNARSSMRLAGAPAVRWSTVLPFHPNHASKQIDGVRSGA